MPLHGQMIVLPLTRARVGSWTPAQRWGILRAVVVFLVQILSVYYLCCKFIPYSVELGCLLIPLNGLGGLGGRERLS